MRPGRRALKVILAGYDPRCGGPLASALHQIVVGGSMASHRWITVVLVSFLAATAGAEGRREIARRYDGQRRTFDRSLQAARDKLGRYRAEGDVAALNAGRTELSLAVRAKIQMLEARRDGLRHKADAARSKGKAERAAAFVARADKLQRTIDAVRTGAARFQMRHGIVGQVPTFLPAAGRTYPVSFERNGIKHGFFVRFSETVVSRLREGGASVDIKSGRVVRADGSSFSMAGNDADWGWVKNGELLTQRTPVTVDIDNNRFVFRVEKGDFYPDRSASFSSGSAPGAGALAAQPLLESLSRKLKRAGIDALVQVQPGSFAAAGPAPAKCRVQQLARKVADDPGIVWKDTNNCHARAHLVEAAAKEMGIGTSAKIFVHGLLQPPRINGESATWGFHVASLVVAENKRHERTLSVIDPAFSRRPMPAERWIKKFASGPVVVEVTDGAQYAPPLEYGNLGRFATTLQDARRNQQGRSAAR
jgi:hypothetical protein